MALPMQLDPPQLSSCSHERNAKKTWTSIHATRTSVSDPVEDFVAETEDATNDENEVEIVN